MWPKKKAVKNVVDAPHRSSIRHATLRLIATANRAEALGAQAASVESTLASEVITARDLVAVQGTLRTVIEKALHTNTTVENLYAQIIEPVLDEAIVSDLAWTALMAVINSAKQRSPTHAGFVSDKYTAA